VVWYYVTFLWSTALLVRMGTVSRQDTVTVPHTTRFAVTVLLGVNWPAMTDAREMLASGQ